MTQQHISLNGDWRMAWYDGQRGHLRERLIGADADLTHTYPAQVPGSVHLDLIRAGLLAEPTEGLDHLAARWVQEAIWLYRRTFDAPALAPGERAWLNFGRLELAATIYLNGVEVGRHANAFYPCRVDVTDTLLEGENVLLVVIEAGLFYASQRPSVGYGMHMDQELARRNWLRTVQSSFGWDWSTLLLNVGITEDVTLEIAAGVRYDRMVALATVSDDLRTGHVTARIFAEGLTDAAQEGKLIVDVGDLSVEVPVTIQPGANRLAATVDVPNPELWWPVGHGAQPLHTVRATLVVGDEEVAEDTRKVGFRRVRINQEPHPEGGNYFIIEVNNKPIFCKGANFVPADMLTARLDHDRYATLVDRAIELNFNLLRIWGGGLYESDAFYEECDARGVLVWQEFIFACAKYPATDPDFLADVKLEARHQTRRLAHHPSLIVWCGNNEMEEGNYHWGYEKGVAHPDYALFHMVLPIILKEEDGTRYYQPSSPFSPDLESPRRDDMGDQHPWTVGFRNTEFRDYRAMISRFPNEGGILGPTALPTVLACLPPGRGADTPLDFVNDKPLLLAWDQHDNGIASGGEYIFPDEMLHRWLGRDITEFTVAEWVYWGGVVQGEGLTEYIRNFRRRMFSTASAIFWMYNDCWPAVRSWTVVDYYLRRTPSFHPVRRACKPLAVAIAVEDGKVKIFGVNEGPAWAGDVRYGLFALAGGYPVDATRAVELPANASTLLAEFDAAEWAQLGETTHAAFAILSRDGAEVARDRLFMPYFKEMVWPVAEVTVRQEGGKAIFESDAFAWRVCLDLDGDTRLPDNFFDIFPGVPTVLEWPDALGEPKIVKVANG